MYQLHVAHDNVFLALELLKLLFTQQNMEEYPSKQVNINWILEQLLLTNHQNNKSDHPKEMMST